MGMTGTAAGYCEFFICSALGPGCVGVGITNCRQTIPPGCRFSTNKVHGSQVGGASVGQRTTVAGGAQPFILKCGWNRGPGFCGANSQGNRRVDAVRSPVLI